MSQPEEVLSLANATFPRELDYAALLDVNPVASYWLLKWKDGPWPAVDVWRVTLDAASFAPFEQGDHISVAHDGTDVVWTRTKGSAEEGNLESVILRRSELVDAPTVVAMADAVSGLAVVGDSVYWCNGEPRYHQGRASVRQFRGGVVIEIGSGDSDCRELRAATERFVYWERVDCPAGSCTSSVLLYDVNARTIEQYRFPGTTWHYVAPTADGAYIAADEHSVLWLPAQGQPIPLWSINDGITLSLRAVGPALLWRTDDREIANSGLYFYPNRNSAEPASIETAIRSERDDIFLVDNDVYWQFGRFALHRASIRCGQ